MRYFEILVFRLVYLFTNLEFNKNKMSKVDNTADSWIYSLNQEELVNELINRSLPTDSPPSLLRERLLRSDRVSSDELNIVDSDYDLP